MKKSSTFLYLLMFLSGIISQSCAPPRNNTCEPTYYRLNRLVSTSLTNKNGAKRSNFYSTDSSAINEVPNTDTLGINLQFVLNYYVENPKNDFSFFPTAIAFPPICLRGGKGTKEKIKKITLTSNSDFDSLHAKNQSLNDLFFVYVTDNALGNYTVPLEDFLNKMYAESLEVAFYHTSIKENFSIFLKTKPNLETNHVFTVLIEYSDGRKFETKTWGVLFL